jgi:predicted nucleic acid-binding protein
MSDVISNTSPMLYLHRIGVLDWLPKMFGEIWIPYAVVHEFKEGLDCTEGMKFLIRETIDGSRLSALKIYLLSGSH